MKRLIALATLVLGLQANASGFQIPLADLDEIGPKMTGAVQALLGKTRASNLQINWTGQCSGIANDLDPTVPLGMCVYDVTGFMIVAKVAVFKTANGYVTQVIYLDLD